MSEPSSESVSEPASGSLSEPASGAPTETESDPSRTPVARIGRALVFVVLLGVLPAFLRLWPIEHGAPRTEYVPDTHIVRNALNMAATKDPVPEANAYSSYPYLLPYVMLPVYAADYVAGKAAGDWAGTGEYGMRLKENPWRAHRLARIVLALLAATAPLFVFLAARASGMRLGAWVAAWLAGTSLLHIQLSTMERPWAPMTAAIAATAWGAAVHTRTGTTRSLLLAGVAAAVAGSMHQGGVLALGICGVAWALAPERGKNGVPPGRTMDPANLKRRVGRGFACVGLFLVVALTIGHPYFLVHGLSSSVAADDLVRDDQTQVTIGAQQVVLGFRMATLTGMTRAFFGYDPVLLVLGLGGLVLALRRRMLIPGMVFLLGWGGFFLTNYNEHIRYLLPMAILMTLPAGLAVERLAVHRAARLTVVALLVIPLVQALRLGTVLHQDDTRSVGEQLLAQLPEGALVAIDMYGPVPPQTEDTLAITAMLRELHGREQHRQMMLEADQPQATGVPLIRMEDVFEYDLRHGGTWIRSSARARAQTERGIDLGETPRSALTALGATHVLLVDRTPDDGVLPPLLDPTPARPHVNDGPDGDPVPKLPLLKLEGPPLWTVHPAWKSATVPDDREAIDAHLPTALPFPLRDLWAVERPGPKLRLYAL